MLRLILNLALITSLIGCSSKRNPDYRSETGLSTLKQDKLDRYLSLNPEDPDYLVLTNELIHDFLQVSEAALRSKNSGHALKVSSIGVQLFPFRNDLVDLKKQSISTFKETTLLMLESSNVNCSEITKRVKFLKAFAPDEMIEQQSNQCQLENVQAFDMDTILKKLQVIESKAFVLDEKKYFTAKEKDLDDIIRKNNELPMMDALMASLKYLSSFQLNLSDFKIDPDTQSDDEVILYAEQVDKYFPEVGKLTVAETVIFSIISVGIYSLAYFLGNYEPNEYCDQLISIFHVENTSTSFRCEYRLSRIFFSDNLEPTSTSTTTSKKILQYKDIVFNSSNIPHFIVMKVRAKTSENKNIERNYLMDAPDNYGKGISQISNLFNIKIQKDSEYNNDPLFPSTFCRLGEYCIYGDRDFTTSLLNVSMSIDLKRTLLLNGQIWNSFLAFENDGRRFKDEILPEIISSFRAEHSLLWIFSKKIR